MWVLIIVTFAINDPPSRGYVPVVQMQEFTSEQRCVAAKEWISARLGTEVADMNKILAERTIAGEVRDFVAVRFSADCKPK
jgi:hypothetical protein